MGRRAREDTSVRQDGDGERGDGVVARLFGTVELTDRLLRLGSSLAVVGDAERELPEGTDPESDLPDLGPMPPSVPLGEQPWIGVLAAMRSPYWRSMKLLLDSSAM